MNYKIGTDLILNYHLYKYPKTMLQFNPATRCGYGAYSVIHKISDKQVVKVFLPDHRFLGLRYPVEHDITSRLHHPNLLLAREITPTGYLVFDHYPYTLWSDEVLSLDWQKKAYLLQQLFSAIDALHQSGYVHLDIKGDNILIDKTCQELVLADFGAALWIGCNKGRSSPRELIIDDLKAPELLINKAKGEKKQEYYYTPAVDLWSTGLVCIEFLTSTKPAYRQSPHLLQTWEKYFQEDEKKNSYLSSLIPDQEWREIISTLLSWDPKKRKLPPIAIPHHVTMFQSKYPSSVYWPVGDYNREILSFFNYLCDNNGDCHVEAFYLAVDLFFRASNLITRRSHRLASPLPTPIIEEEKKIKDDVWLLLMASFWIAIKIVDGLSYDILSLYEDLPINIEYEDLITTEIDIIREVKGCLYPPNIFTSASSINELLIAWRYLFIPGLGEEIKTFPGKDKITIRLYAYYMLM